MSKVVAFFKKVGSAIATFAKKCWAAVTSIQWTSNVRPLIAWPVYGGVVALTVALMLIFWL